MKVSKKQSELIKKFLLFELKSETINSELYNKLAGKLEVIGFNWSKFTKYCLWVCVFTGIANTTI